MSQCQVSTAQRRAADQASQRESALKTFSAACAVESEAAALSKSSARALAFDASSPSWNHARA